MARSADSDEGAVSDDEFRRSLIEKEGFRPRSEQSDLYRFMTDPEQAELRAWVDSALDVVSVGTATKLRATLRTPQFGTAICELAVGEQLAKTGFDALYEPSLDGRTPDFYIEPTATHRGLIVEVWSRQPRDGTGSRRRGWHALAQRVESIPVPLVMALTSCPTDPPTPKESKQLVRELNAWALRSLRVPGDRCPLGPFTFAVLRLGQGLRASLVIPAESAVVDSDDILQVIRTKTTRYRSGAERRDAEFVIVLVSPPSSALALDGVLAALGGTLTVSINFSPFSAGPIASGPVKLRHANVPVVLDAALSGVGFLDLNSPPQGRELVVIANGAARRPMTLRDPIAMMGRDGLRT